MPAERAVDEIVRDLRAGRDSESNFRMLFLRFQPQVFRFFIRKGVASEDARELTQEVFLSVYKSIMNLQSDAQFVAWLITIARNSFAHYLQRRHALKRAHVEASSAGGGAEERGIELDNLAGYSTDPLTQLLEQEKLTRLRAALTELPEQMRRCVHLRIACENSYEEISTLLGISINTVKAHLHKARNALREKLSGDLGDLEV